MRCFQSPYGLVPAAHRLLIGLYIITPYIVSLDKLLGATTILTQGGRAALPSYSVTDLTIRYQPEVKWDVIASVQNLFGASVKSYTEEAIAGDIPLPGRNYNINFSYRY